VKLEVQESRASSTRADRTSVGLCRDIRAKVQAELGTERAALYRDLTLNLN